ncbi:MAG: HAMP domain-containing sensor histidine kinase [Eubacteriales bacterium]|nr:HAMP domain-containing sensor histidine kinase [Eubacteriales bacterium]
MTEKKKWYYTGVGKVLRGFLCLMTLALCTSGTMYLIQMFSSYGDDFLKGKEASYESTQGYRVDLVNSMRNTLDFVEVSCAKHEFTVYDVENQEQWTCDYKKDQAVEQDEQYLPVVEKASMEMHFDDLDWITENIQVADGERFVHFSKKQFQKLFELCGSKNTNYRYSHDYPESTYFVFANQDTVTGILDESKNGALGYALYNPEEDLFYSTWDQYFPSYNHYLYRCDEILSNIQGNLYGMKVENIIMPLLWAHNYTQMEMHQIYYEMPAEQMDIAMNMKRNMENGPFLYYIERANGEVISNVENIEEITKLDRFYYLGDYEKLQYPEAENVRNLSELEYLGCDVYIDSFNGMMYMGMDFARAKQDQNYDADGIYVRYQRFEIAQKHGMWILLLLIVLYLLLVYQTISLIVTTGRVCKKPKTEDGQDVLWQVHLNFFDQLFTEPYLILEGFVLLGATVVGANLFLEFMNEIENRPIVALIGMAGCAAGYGLIFMLFVLSFIRRIKAKNFISKMGFGKLWKWIVGIFVKIYQQQKGRRWLRSLFDIYLGFQVILAIFIFYLTMDEGGLTAILAVIMGSVLPNVFIVMTMKKLFGDMDTILKCIEEIKNGDLEYQCDVDREMHFLNEIADGVNHIGDGLKIAVEQSIKDERMRTELITNVSHDLKTPLTSIINYVDLLKKEEMYSENAKHYLDVLDTKSQRLKHLTEDLVEAAKANTGNIELECMPLAFDELMRQAIGEFEDKFATRNLTVVASYPETPAVIMADGRRLFRIIENVLVNAYKYALEGTRIYADLVKEGDEVVFTLKNISEAPLNISPEELMERFTRGDSSRTTEGSGLGLSIAKDLTYLMEGVFALELDGDLFKVIVKFSGYNHSDN